MNKKLMKEKIKFLENQISNQSELLRKLLSETDILNRSIETTKINFNFQWRNVQYFEDVEKSIYNILKYTQLLREWFSRKDIMDVGSGNGRFSYAFCRLGSRVLSTDISPEGLKNTSELCKYFPHHKILKSNILDFEPLDYFQHFDLVWCYGVIHHTGNAYKAFKNIAQLVKKNGYIFLMVYGEPRQERIEDYKELNEYEFLRKITKNITSDDKLSIIRHYHKSNIHGYFDAISPVINELFSWKELEDWLINEGFVDIKRTINSRNHHIIAKKER